MNKIGPFNPVFGSQSKYSFGCLKESRNEDRHNRAVIVLIQSSVSKSPGLQSRTNAGPSK
jgi:hypothetical protein